MSASAIAVCRPHAFYKPGVETIDRVAAGESVKLIFAFGTNNPDAPCTKRFWVTVGGIKVDSVFSSRLDNCPQYIRDLSLGERIVSETRHIVNAEHDPRETSISHYAWRCFVTRRVIDEEEAVSYPYREIPEEENDNGQRLMVDDELDDYVNTAGTTAYVNLDSVLDADDSILPLPDAPPGRAFERLTGGPFIEARGPEG